MQNLIENLEVIVDLVKQGYEIEDYKHLVIEEIFKLKSHVDLTAAMLVDANDHSTFIA